MVWKQLSIMLYETRETIFQRVWGIYILRNFRQSLVVPNKNDLEHQNPTSTPSYHFYLYLNVLIPTYGCMYIVYKNISFHLKVSPERINLGKLFFTSNELHTQHYLNELKNLIYQKYVYLKLSSIWVMASNRPSLYLYYTCILIIENL